MNSNSKVLLVLILGAAAGAAIGFYMASDNKEELISDLKDTASRIKNDLEGEIEKGKRFVDDLKGKVSDLLEKA